MNPPSKQVEAKSTDRHEGTPALVYAISPGGEPRMVDIVPSEYVPKSQEGIDALIQYERLTNNGDEIIIAQGKTPLGSDMS